MKNNIITKLGSLLLILLCFNSYGNPTKNTSIVDNQNPPQQPPPILTEVVRLNIEFQTLRCQIDRNMYGCNVGNPVDPSGITKDIVLSPVNEICKIETDDKITSCYSFRGHWIDLEQTYHFPGKRYIGIVSITKSTNSKASKEDENHDWYHIEVEILGKGKTIAKMETGVRTISQLQAVKLLADEVEDESSRTTTFLNVSYNLFPEVKDSKLNFEQHKFESPAKWKLIKGRILE